MVFQPQQPNVERAAEFDLSVPEHAYIFGLFQTDGHLRSEARNRGYLALELSDRDADIIHKVSGMLPVTATINTRSRTTNFTNGRVVGSHILRVHDWGFRLRLIELGLPEGRKSAVIAPPTAPYSVPDYWRGVIDGDGSLGITPSTRKPFVSLVTDSDVLADSFRALLFDVTGRTYLAGRNQRDGAYNIMTTGKYAQALAVFLYYDGCLSMDRKAASARAVAEWTPEETRPRKGMRRWTPDEDAVLLKDGPEAAAELTGRSIGAAEGRLYYIQPSKHHGHARASSWGDEEDNLLVALGVSGFLESGTSRSEGAATMRLHRLKTGRA